MDQLIPLTHNTVRRGCGTRVTHGLYACTGVTEGDDSPLAQIELLINDPPIPWNRFRGHQLHQRRDGIWDLIMWVGQEYYPTVPDFVEEARRHGVSRRLPLPRSADYSLLTPWQSMIRLVHARAVVHGEYFVTHHLLPGTSPRLPARPSDCYSAECTHRPKRELDVTSCTFALWDLSALHHVEDLHSVQVDTDLIAQVETPSVSYAVNYPLSPEDTPPRYSPGVFLSTFFTHFEYVNPTGDIPVSVAEIVGDNLNHIVVRDQ